ncbi:Uncharacterised protein [Mycobacteroides abscessus subsp. abscessus]|nr:Uncharacterised protein [Mycobacteroides abscessus subsp. abscessus]
MPDGGVSLAQRSAVNGVGCAGCSPESLNRLSARKPPGPPDDPAAPTAVGSPASWLPDGVKSRGAKEPPRLFSDGTAGSCPRPAMSCCGANGSWNGTA